MTVSVKAPTSTTGSIQLNGSDVLNIESDRSVDIDSGTLHVDATNNRVGIGTSSPDTELQITSTGVKGLHLKDTSTNGSPRLFLTNDTNTWTIYNVDDDLSIRANATVGTSSGTEVFRIEQATGYVALNDVKIGAAKITIANNAVGTITPPKNGGFLMISANGDTSFPAAPESGILAYDVGGSVRMDLLLSSGWSGNFSSDLEVATGALTGSSATANKVMVSANTGQLEINNRQGSTITFDLTFL